MATTSSDLDDQKTGANIQIEGDTLTPPSSQKGPEEREAFGSAPSCLPSSLQQGNQHLTAMRLGTVWKYK